jgi:diguanylate cyclase (GGDEF)-like protein
MATKSVNGNGVASASRVGTGQYRHNGAASLSQLNGDAVIKSTAGTHRQQLEAARRQIDSLVKLVMVLREQSVLLTESLASAHRFAFHDELTNLPNRRLLKDRFKMAVARAKRKHSKVVLLLLDLDNFKGINDTVGHLAADRLLQQVASRLTACIRGSDTACRFGGDELVIVLPEIETPDDAIATIEKIRAELATPYEIDGMPVRITVSIGMATWPIDGKDCPALLKVADVAMYREKRRCLVACGTAASTVPAGLDQAIARWRQANQNEKGADLFFP